MIDPDLGLSVVLGQGRINGILERHECASTRCIQAACQQAGSMSVDQSLSGAPDCIVTVLMSPWSLPL